MGGGRNKEGTALYKYTNGKYIRIGAYKDNAKEVNRLIDELMSSASGALSAQDYLKAIEKRDRNAVLDLDKKLKKGELSTGENQKKLAVIRKKLLELAKDEPEKITNILDSTNKKIAKKSKEEWAKSTPAQKAVAYQQWYKGKKFRLKRDVSVGPSWAPVSLYEPAGKEVGTFMKVKYFTTGPVPEIGIPEEVHFQFLMDQGNGYKKWYSAKDLELVKE